MKEGLKKPRAPYGARKLPQDPSEIRRRHKAIYIVIQHRMNHVVSGANPSTRQGMIRSGKYRDILLIPPLYKRMALYVRPNCIQRNVSVVLEQPHPVRQVLLVNVIGSILAGDRC